MIDAIARERPRITELCRRFHVRRLDLFGSAARGTDFSDGSDVDFLVDYEAGQTPDFGDYLALRDALVELLGRDVDLVMASAVRNPYLRAAIERSRQTIHEA